MKRDHRDEHPGCKVMWPWLRWCSNYRYASQVVQMCLDDIQTMDPQKLKSTFDICNRTPKYSKRRSGPRDMYISHRERWNDDEYDEIRESTELLMANLPADHHFFEGRTLKEQIEHTYFARQQARAVRVLYAYGMFDRSTGVIVLDNLKKLK